MSWLVVSPFTEVMATRGITCGVGVTVSSFFEQATVASASMARPAGPKARVVWRAEWFVRFIGWRA